MRAVQSALVLLPGDSDDSVHCTARTRTPTTVIRTTRGNRSVALNASSHCCRKRVDVAAHAAIRAIWPHSPGTTPIRVRRRFPSTFVRCPIAANVKSGRKSEIASCCVRTAMPRPTFPCLTSVDCDRSKGTIASVDPVRPHDRFETTGQSHILQAPSSVDEPPEVPAHCADMEYGRCACAPGQFRFGSACMVKRSSPPAMISSWRRKARSSGLPSRVALPT